MSSSKARSLRERMSIDPDEPAPVSRPRRPRPEPTSAEPTSTEPTPAEDLAGESPRGEVRGAGAPRAEAPTGNAPGVGGPPVDVPGVGASPAESTAADSARPATPPRSPATRSSSKRRHGRRQRDDPGWATALDDPAVSSGGNGYRSFYVSDEVFARFRAAVYWTGRRPDAPDVPDNMSVGVEDYMEQLATDLERRFNDRAPFPPTPEQVRSHRRRQNGDR